MNCMHKEQVKSTAAGRWRDIVRSVGIVDKYLTGDHGPCPKCDGKDRWRVYDDFNQTGGAICNQCGPKMGDGFALVQWFLDCDYWTAVKQVAAVLGMKSMDNDKSQFVATYDYTDEAGELLFQVCRMDPKDFRQRRRDGNGDWEWKVKGVRQVPYRLLELLAADASETVVVCEGEKDVDNLARIGVKATCNAGGAGKWSREHAAFLAGRDVVVVADRDEPGRKHAQVVAKSLHGLANSIRVIELPTGKDASDWIAGGGTRCELEKLIGGTEQWRLPVHVSKDVTKPHYDLLHPDGRTEAANAKRLVARFGDVMRWCEPWGKWLVWDGKRWKVDDERRFEALAKTVANELWDEAAALAKTADGSTTNEILKFVRASNQATGIRNMVFLSRSDVAIVPTFLDMHPWLLNVDNGTLDLRTGVLRPHDRDDCLTQLCPVPYEPTAPFPTWRRFIETVLAGDQELIVYLQRLIGYCLTGSTREHLLPFLFGMGANGKSTFIGTLLAMLGPDYAIKAPTDLLLAKRDTHPTERADLYGKRLVACVEAEGSRRLAESLVKELTGGDRVRARRMRENYWEFQATHKIWLAANHKPVVRGTDHGIWRRIKLLPFTVAIPDDQQDKDLLVKLLDELPGILAWSVEGCRQWLGDGLHEPACVRTATGDYRNEMDLVGRFLVDCCIIDPAASLGAMALYTSFKAWCDRTGEQFVNQTRFGGQLTERGFQIERTRVGIVRHGLKLTGDA